MATVKDWVEGIRLRTLPAALSPVIVGAGFSAAMEKFSWLYTLLALVVAVFIQIGANLSNDYSDGVRGTDDFREGPPRLTGGHKAKPKTVLVAALVSYALASIAGVVLVWLSGHWWLLIVGVAAILAAWLYTGGKHPYGYTAGISELFVLVFFGYAATVGTVYVQTDQAPLLIWILATGVGFIACALLMVNNIRDIPTDEKAGKKTLVVRIGQTKARWIYYILMALAVVLASMTYLWDFGIFVGMLAMLVWVVIIARPVTSGATGADLLPALRNTALFELVYAVLIAGGLVLNHFYPSSYWGITGWVITAAVWVIWLIVEVVFSITHSRKNHNHQQASQQQENSDFHEPTHPELPEAAAQPLPANVQTAAEPAVAHDTEATKRTGKHNEKNTDLGLA